jgi:hypothetical protein
MRVVAALAWWNETPEDLAACIKAAANIADEIVAVDGAYRRYPNATVRSDPKQAAAIRKAAKAVGMECRVIIPDQLWAGQIEKRTFLLREAAKDADWIMVLDADHIVHTDRVAARDALERMPAKVNTVGVDFWTAPNPDSELSPSWWHTDMVDKTFHMAHFFRPLEDLTVRGFHWMYYGKRDGSTVRMDYGGPADAPLGVPYVVEHRNLFRTEQQILDSRAFLNDRVMVVAKTGQEDDAPGLPEPVWDYETIPFRRENSKPADPDTLPARRKAAQEWIWSVNNLKRPVV